MASAKLSADLNYLTDAAHLLRSSAPETSAHLMRTRAELMFHNNINQHEVQRQHVCGGCGHIMIPGEESALRLEGRKVQNKRKQRLRQKQTQEPSSSGPTKTITCGHCTRATKVILQAPDRPVRQRRKASRATAPKSQTSETQNTKVSTNASSKKRAKTRKGGLQALLSGQQQKSSGSLSLSDFMR